jgi:hypothetical protein
VLPLLVEVHGIAKALDREAVRDALLGGVDTLEASYRGIYKKGYPAFNRQLDSNLTF